MAGPGQFLITLAGARADILKQCPSERVKFQSLGWVIMITSAMAVVSMWFALTSAMGIAAAIAFPVALLWGLIIMGIDRWLVTSLPAEGNRKLLLALPRLALAILLGALISTPIMLRVFESEINNQITVIKADRAAAYLNSQEHSQVQAQVTKWQNTVNNLNGVIQSGGLATINPANDPEVQSLNSQKASALKLEQQYYKEWQCQLYGGCGAPPGNGVLAQASQAQYQTEVQQVASLTSQIQKRETALQASDQASKASRLHSAQQQLPGAEAQLNAAERRQTALTNSFDSTNQAANGLLIRLQALGQITGGNLTLGITRTLLFLLFLIIEVLPVTVKLLQRPGPYEELLETVVKSELRRAKNAASASDRPRQATAVLPEGGPMREPAPHTYDRQYLRDMEVGQLWAQRPSQAAPPGGEGSTETDLLDMEDGELDADEASRYDEALRRLTDLRDVSSFDPPREDRAAARYRPQAESPVVQDDEQGRRPGGFDLHFEDDEL
jgi:hypothetical protein